MRNIYQQTVHGSVSADQVLCVCGEIVFFYRSQMKIYKLNALLCECFFFTKVKNISHSPPHTPPLGHLFQRLKMAERIQRHHCKLTWGRECGCVWQESEASRPPNSRISFSLGWWTVSNSTSFGRSGDTEASFCRKDGEDEHNACVRA